MGIREVNSTAGSVFSFTAASHYSASGCSSARPICGSIGFIAVGCIVFLLSRAVTLPSVARTPSSSRSASCHGLVYWEFPVPDPSPVRGAYSSTRPACNPFPVLSPICGLYLSKGLVCHSPPAAGPVPSPVWRPHLSTGPIYHPLPIVDPIIHPLQLTGIVFQLLKVTDPISFPIALSACVRRAVEGIFPLFFVGTWC